MISCITLKFCVSARQHFCLSVCLYLVPDNMHSQWSVVWFNSVSRTVCLLICLLKCLTVSLSICLCKVCLDVCLFAFLSLFCYWQTIYNLLVVSKYRVFIKYCVFFEDFKIFRTLTSLCFPSVSLCVHKPGKQNTSSPAELTECRKITKFEGKNTLFNKHPVAQNGTKLDILSHF